MFRNKIDHTALLNGIVDTSICTIVEGTEHSIYCNNNLVYKIQKEPLLYINKGTNLIDEYNYLLNNYPVMLPELIKVKSDNDYYYILKMKYVGDFLIINYLKSKKTSLKYKNNLVVRLLKHLFLNIQEKKISDNDIVYLNEILHTSISYFAKDLSLAVLKKSINALLDKHKWVEYQNIHGDLNIYNVYLVKDDFVFLDPPTTNTYLFCTKNGINPKILSFYFDFWMLFESLFDLFPELDKSYILNNLTSDQQYKLKSLESKFWHILTHSLLGASYKELKTNMEYMNSTVNIEIAQLSQINHHDILINKHELEINKLLGL